MTTAKESLTGPSISPPPCSAEDPQHPSSSKGSTDNLNQRRCEFTFSDGRQCRNQRAQFCVHHASQKQSGSASAELESPELVALCSDLTTATNINRALAQVFLLTAQGRISQKQAVAFGYLSQLLLQTVPGIRSEFVSAFGYHPWQENLTMRLKSSGSAAKGYPQDALSPLKKVGLRTSLESNLTMRPASSSRATNPSEGSLSDSPSTPDENPGLTGQNDQSEPATTVSTLIDKPIVDRRPFEERVMEPDYDSIVSRGRDLLAGKYSVTPEGRREAETLNTELELMKPPAAKMPKGARASVIEHMKRWIAQKKVTMRPASSSRPPAKVYPPAGESHGDQELSRVNKVNVSEGPLRSPAPPALNYYGHPIPMAVPYDEIERASDFTTPTPSPRTSPPADKLSLPPNSEISNIKSPVVPVSPPSSRTSTVSSDRPPTRHPRNPRGSAHAPASEPSPRPSSAPLAPEIDSDPRNRTVHATDWYTPPAWSKNRASDPFPNRKEKRKREFRGMSNSKLRHLQHLNSRAF